MARPRKMKRPPMVPKVSDADAVAVGDLATIRQLQAWIQKDPEAVLNELNRLREYQDSTVQMYEDLVERFEASTVKVEAVEQELRDTKRANNKMADTHNDLQRANESLTQMNKDLKESNVGQKHVIEHQRQELREFRGATPGARFKPNGPNRVTKTTKLPDPAVYTGSADEDIEDWIAQMEGKLECNADHYPTDRAQISYVQTRLGGDARKNTAPRMKKDFFTRYASAYEIFKHLYELYSAPFRRQTAQAEFRKLEQGKDDFPTFFAHFQRLTEELQYPDDMLIDELRNKLHPVLRKAMAKDRDPADFKVFGKNCLATYRFLNFVRMEQLAKDELKYVPAAASTSSTTNILPTKPSRVTTPTRLIPQAREQLMKEVKCFKCGAQDYVSQECTTTRTTMTSASTLPTKFTEGPLTVTCNIGDSTSIALIATECSGYAFIDTALAWKVCDMLQIQPMRLSKPKRIHGIDENESKAVTHAIYTPLKIHDHTESRCCMYITDLDQHSVILGRPWMKKYGVVIDTANDKLAFKPGYCTHPGAPKLAPAPKTPETMATVVTDPTLPRPKYATRQTAKRNPTTPDYSKLRATVKDNVVVELWMEDDDSESESDSGDTTIEIATVSLKD